MQGASSGVRGSHGIAFVGTYLPRACGIATFTRDLVEAVAAQAARDELVIVAAMDDRTEGYSYPDRVKFEVRQDYQIDYSRAADFMNFSRIDVVSLQHEFGIFGGKCGANVLTMLRDLHRPVVVTCHTVAREPEPVQREVFAEIAARADRLVVMDQRGGEVLEDIYGVNRDKVAYIPHGIHDVPFVDPSYYKDKFGVEGQRVLLTFGLLHGGKGIEHMIEALPAIVARHPRTTYVVLGATHPTVLRNEGEAYRLSLQRRVRDLGLEEHVLFHPRFVGLDELLEYLGATDIFVTPYVVREQSTSGALAYAAGCGKAVVSTRYRHAEELLAGGRGRLVPMCDSDALAREIIALLDDEVALASMRKKAYLHCRKMVWPSVARSYLQLFDEVRGHVPMGVPKGSAMRRPIAATNLPLPKLDHLTRLSDDTGPCRYARHTVPDWSFGYRLDDAASALVVATRFHDIFGTAQAARIIETCLALVQTLIGDGRELAAGLDYTRNRVGRADDVALGKTIRGLGYLVWRGPSFLVEAAHDLLQEMLGRPAPREPRGVAYAVLGAANYLRRLPGAAEVRRRAVRQARELEECCNDPEWIERWPGPDWPVAVQALSMIGRVTDDDGLRRHATELVARLLDATDGGTVFLSRGDNPEEEELPSTAATFIEALGAVYYDGRDRNLLKPIRSAADWFLGANRLGEPLYDFATGGCHDALTATGLNQNLGTEATVHCLLAFLTLHRMSGLDTAAEGREPSSG